jgi:signal transduction histidine kinase
VTDLNQTFDASERTVLTAEDRKIPVLKTVVNAHIGGKKVLVESFIDITEQKRAEEALRRANAQLNLLNSVNRHDIANQLTVLQGYTQLARMKKPEPVIADFLRKIDEASDVIARQLEFTRTYQDLGMHAPGWHNLSAIIGKVQPEHVAVTMTCPDTEIFADPMLENVFANLFDNSIRHGRCVTEITVSCEPVPDGYMVTVRDNGAGIPLNEKDKIFSKGYGRHTGFGLFLAREILAITGISIHETGKHGRGARFEITVPRGGYRCSGQAKDT